MILNDTLQKRQDCLKQCELEFNACDLKQKDEETCNTELKKCECECDFDYGP